MSNCFNIHSLQHFSELDGSRWKKAHPDRHSYQLRDSRHFTWALLCWYFPTPCWTAAVVFENDSLLHLSVKSNRLHHRFFQHASTSLRIFTLGTISGGKTKRLLRPGWLPCTLLPEGPSWLLLGPSWEPSMAQNIIWGFLIQYTWSTVKAVVQLYNTVLKTSTACHKRMQRNFRTKDIYLDKTERPEYRNKLNLRVQKHNFILPNTNFLV